MTSAQKSSRSSRKHSERKCYLIAQPIKYLRNPGRDSEKAVRSLLQRIADFAHDRLKADACSIFLVNDEQTSAIQMAGTGYQSRFASERLSIDIARPDQVPEDPKPRERLGLTTYILSTGFPILAESPEELRRHPHHTGKYDSLQAPGKRLKVHTFLGVPIHGLHQEVRGLIKAERCIEPNETVEPFSSEDQCTLSNIAMETWRCLEYLNHSMEGNPQDAVTAWTMDVLSMASITEPDLPSFVNVASEVLAAAAQAESCSVFLVDQDGKYLTQIGGHGFQSEGNLIRTYPMPDAGTPAKLCGGLTAYIAASGDSVYAPSHEALRAEPAWKGKFDAVNFQGKEERWCVAFLGLPIQVGAKTIGVLKLENSSRTRRKTDDPFPKDLQRQCKILTQHLALTIRRLQNTETSRSAVIEKASKSINEILHGGGEMEELVARAIGDIREALNAEACALFVKEGNELVQHIWGAVGYYSDIGTDELRKYQWRTREEIESLGIQVEKEKRVGLTVWIASMDRKFVSRSHDEHVAHPHHLGLWDRKNYPKSSRRRCESFMGVPLKVDGETLGVLKIENKKGSANNYVAFSAEDELVFELLASSVANAIYYRRKRAETNRGSFLSQIGVARDADTMWALGLRHDHRGLQGFPARIPPLPDDAVVVRTLSLGICGTDREAFGGNVEGEYDLIGFHEAVGEVAWIGPAVDRKRMKEGDIVIPVVRRCQGWESPLPGTTGIDFGFHTCKEAERCQSYRRPDACPHGEYGYWPPHAEKIGYRSRGTGKCHGFGSEYFVDTAEWLVRACTKEERGRKYDDRFISSLVLAEPLSVVWKMKREIEQVRPVRPLQDRILTLGLGPIGYLATVVMCRMYPGLGSTSVDRIPKDKLWITSIEDPKNHIGTRYLPLGPDEVWHPSLRGNDGRCYTATLGPDRERHPDLPDDDGRFDLIIEATGNPQEVIGQAVEVLAPNGIIVLLSVVGKDSDPSVHLSSSDLNAVVKKNGKIIGSVNESREDFENAIQFLQRFHSDKSSYLDSLMCPVDLDPGTWSALGEVEEELKKPWTKRQGPKIVLKAPRP